MNPAELFISKLDPADGSEADESAPKAAKKKGFSLDHRPNWLHVESLQHLEHNTGAVGAPPAACAFALLCFDPPRTPAGALAATAVAVVPVRLNGTCPAPASANSSLQWSW